MIFKSVRTASCSFIVLFSAIASAAGEATNIDNASDAASIYRVEPLRDGLIIGSTTLGTIWAYAESGRLIHPRCPCNISEVNSFDRPVIGNTNDFLDHVSDVTVAAAVAFPIVLDLYDVGWSKEFAEDMTVLAETLSINGGLVTLAKYTVQRPLPRTYQGDPDLVDNPRGYRSFYSGHTSVALSAMSTAVVTHRLRHPEDVWPIYAAAAVGASVAYERVAAGRHFYTDVIVGGLVGTAVGVTVPLLHRRSQADEQSIVLLPFEDGAVAVWKIKF